MASDRVRVRTVWSMLLFTHVRSSELWPVIGGVGGTLSAQLLCPLARSGCLSTRGRSPIRVTSGVLCPDGAVAGSCQL